MQQGIETTVMSVQQTTGKKSGKPHMKVEFGNGAKALCFDVALFGPLMDAQASKAKVALTLYQSGKGYTSIDTIGPASGGQAFTAGELAEQQRVSGAPPATSAPAPNPAAPGNPGPAPAGPATPLDVHVDVYMVRALCVLSAAMIGWGGRFIRTPEDMFRWVDAISTYVRTGTPPPFGKKLGENGGAVAPANPASNDRLGGFDEEL